MKRSEIIAALIALILPIILFLSSAPGNEVAGLFCFVWAVLCLVIFGSIAGSKSKKGNTKKTRKRNEDDFLEEFGYIDNSAFNIRKEKK